MKNNRKQIRTATAIGLIVLGTILGVMGFDGWYINHIPASLVGLILGVAGVLGLCGVNVWWGGVLDPRNDHPELPIAPVAPPQPPQAPVDKRMPPDFR
jgi:hypothetical protein